MAEERNGGEQLDIEESGDFAIADDSQIADMQREFQSLGIGEGKNQSRLCVYPLPIYMTGKCLDFCKACKEFFAVYSQLDKMFVERNKRILNFIIGGIEKNRVAIAIKGDLTQEIFVSSQRMPIKQSMYKLIELHNIMGIALDELSIYDKSAEMQEVVTRHLLIGCVLHGICI